MSEDGKPAVGKPCVFWTKDLEKMDVVCVEVDDEEGTFTIELESGQRLKLGKRDTSNYN